MARRLTVARAGNVGGAGLGGLLGGPAKRSLYGGILPLPSFLMGNSTFSFSFSCFCQTMLFGSFARALFPPLRLKSELSNHTFSKSTAPFLRLVRNNSACIPTKSA